VHEIINTSSNCFYFPSYEIMMDDLRDYRFYEKDMLHPNKIAIEYIWEKFSACFFSDACLTAIKDIEPYSKGTMHRPRNPESAASKAFEQKIKKLKDELIAKYPYLGI